MEWIELGELANIETGKLNANAAVENGKYPFFTCADEISKIDEYAYDKECILIAGNGNLNVKYYSGKFNAYQRTYIVESKDINKLNTMYLFYFMNTYMDKLRELSIGGVIKYIKMEHLFKAKIPVPSIEVQKQIVEVLKEAEELINNREKQIDSFIMLISSAFYTMFGDPINNDKDWKVKQLKEVSKINMGQSPPSSSYNKTGEGMPFFQGNADFGEKYPQTRMFTTESKRLANINDILISVRAPVGELNIANGECSIGRGLAALTLTELNVSYLFYLLELKKEEIQSFSTGSTFKAIRKKELEEFNIPTPPLSLQNKFAEKVKVIEEHKELLNKSLELLKESYNSIMNRAFKGELFS